MKVRVKVYGKMQEVEVRDAECPKLKCFHAHKYTHYGKSIDGVSSSWQDKHYSCGNRNYHGCPDNPVKKESLNAK